MLAEQLGHIEEVEARLERLNQEIRARLDPFEEKLQALETIPGVARYTAEVIVSEIGLDMSRFPTSGQLASWTKLCPVGNESAGKRKSGRTGKGNRPLRTALVEAAHAAARTKGTYLSAQYHRLAARRGSKRAAVAVAHSILTIAYHLLKDGGVYQELGSCYLDQLKEGQLVRRMERRLAALGYEVTLQKKAA